MTALLYMSIVYKILCRFVNILHISMEFHKKRIGLSKYRSFDINCNIDLKWYYWSEDYIILMIFSWQIFKLTQLKTTPQNAYIGFRFKISYLFWNSNTCQPWFAIFYSHGYFSSDTSHSIDDRAKLVYCPVTMSQSDSSILDSQMLLFIYFIGLLHLSNKSCHDIMHV